MREKTYQICLSAPLGTRDGTLFLHETEGKAEGWIEIMNHQNPLTGTISEAGEVALCGEIKTLVDAVPYTATGILRGREISLELNTAYGIYAVAGEEVLPD